MRFFKKRIAAFFVVFGMVLASFALQASAASAATTTATCPSGVQIGTVDVDRTGSVVGASDATALTATGSNNSVQVYPQGLYYVSDIVGKNVSSHYDPVVASPGYASVTVPAHKGTVTLVVCGSQSQPQPQPDPVVSTGTTPNCAPISGLNDTTSAQSYMLSVTRAGTTGTESTDADVQPGDKYSLTVNYVAPYETVTAQVYQMDAGLGGLDGTGSGPVPIGDPIVIDGATCS